MKKTSPFTGVVAGDSFRTYTPAGQPAFKENKPFAIAMPLRNVIDSQVVTIGHMGPAFDKDNDYFIGVGGVKRDGTGEVAVSLPANSHTMTREQLIAIGIGCIRLAHGMMP